MGPVLETAGRESCRGPERAYVSGDDARIYPHREDSLVPILRELLGDYPHHDGAIQQVPQDREEAPAGLHTTQY